MDPLILLFGLVVGVLIGLTGVGGGSLMTPLLLLAGGYSPVVTIGTVPVAGLRHALGIILVAAALGVLTKAGVDLPPAALAGIPAALAVVSVVIHRRRAAVERELARQSPTVDDRPVAPRPRF